MGFFDFRFDFDEITFIKSLLTVITCQLSVENEIAIRAAATSEKIEAKQSVTALQKAISNHNNGFSKTHYNLQVSFY